TKAHRDYRGAGVLSYLESPLGKLQSGVVDEKHRAVLGTKRGPAGGLAQCEVYCFGPFREIVVKNGDGKRFAGLPRRKSERAIRCDVIQPSRRETVGRGVMHGHGSAGQALPEN